MIRLDSKRLLGLLALPVVLIAAAVYGTAAIERNVATRAGDHAAIAQTLLTAMLDQETGVRGYFETSDARFLAPWYLGTANFDTAATHARATIGSDHDLSTLLGEQVQRAAAWHASAEQAIAAFEQDHRRPTIASALGRKQAMDAFRHANGRFAERIDTLRNRDLSRASALAVAITAALSIALTIGGLLLWRSLWRRDERRAARHEELRNLLQASVSEEESRSLIVRHLQRAIPGAGAAVLNRNNSDDRLEPTLADDADATPLRGLRTEQLRPRSCLAVRLSRPYQRPAGETALVACDACGKLPGSIECEPLLIGGQVIGSVLVASERALTVDQREDLHDSVVQAAPILANQRHLALAETRAATDLLTGLSNRRAADETVKRMLAHAGRTMSPVAALLIDLDHFKEINDTHGHEVGDRVLAMVGEVLRAKIRTSDFAARYGGEEFLVLLPDTDRAGALTLAEKLRRSISQAEVDGVGAATASVGVALMPDDAGDPEQLLRKADRALYAAKSAGRNRVEAAEPAQWPATGDTAAEGATEP